MQQRKEVQGLLRPARGTKKAVDRSARGRIQRAAAWSAQPLRKALATALEEAIDRAAFGGLDDGDGDAASGARAGANDASWRQLRLDRTEWLLAEAGIRSNGWNANACPIGCRDRAGPCARWAPTGHNDLDTGEQMLGLDVGMNTFLKTPKQKGHPHDGRTVPPLAAALTRDLTVQRYACVGSGRSPALHLGFGSMGSSTSWGYTFGRMYSQKTGKARLGMWPSKKSIRRMVETVHALAAMTGALRTYLKGRGVEVNHTPVRALVPVDLRPPERVGQLGNEWP